MKMELMYPPEATPQKLSPDRIKQVELGLGKLRPETTVKTAVEADPESEQEKDTLSREALKDVLDKTLEVVDLLTPRRHLEYEVIDEADIVQVQVVNTDDGSIVRKIPGDDIVKLVEQIHKVLSDRLDVKA